MFAVRQIRSQRFAREQLFSRHRMTSEFPTCSAFLRRHFRSCVIRLCGFTPEMDYVDHRGQRTKLGVFPIGANVWPQATQKCLTSFWILRQFASMLMPGICGIVVCGPRVQGVAEAMKTAPRLARTFPFSAFHRFSMRRFSRATFNYPKASLRHEAPIHSQSNMFSCLSHISAMDYLESMYPAICCTFQICRSWTPKTVLAEEQFAEHLKEYTEQFQGTKPILGRRNCWEESNIDPHRSHWKATHVRSP